MKKLIKFMKEEKISGPKLARKLKVSNATIYTWLNNTAIPQIGAAIRLDRLSEGRVSVYDWE